ncbi:MAG TPA: hypothetical protein VGK50_09370 [Coriobacteriia bacterium]|jgi:hypothetical protein
MSDARTSLAAYKAPAAAAALTAVLALVVWLALGMPSLRPQAVGEGRRSYVVEAGDLLHGAGAVTASDTAGITTPTVEATLSVLTTLSAEAATPAVPATLAAPSPAAQPPLQPVVNLPGAWPPLPGVSPPSVVPTAPAPPALPPPPVVTSPPPPPPPPADGGGSRPGHGWGRGRED